MYFKVFLFGFKMHCESRFIQDVGILIRFHKFGDNGIGFNIFGLNFGLILALGNC